MNNTTVSVNTMVLGDRMITVTTKDESRVVQWDDIEGSVESDDCYGECPWDDCDGWEHEFEREHWNDHDDKLYSRGRVNRNWRDGGSGYIVIDDDTIRDKWGVSEDRIAEVKRDAIDQLVKWYENGWCYVVACARYDDYSDYLGGILTDDGCNDHAEECVEQCRHEVAAQLERDGYIVEGRPNA